MPGLPLKQTKERVTLEMNMDDQLKAARDECLRRIGRNTVMFQRMEQLLKILLTNSSLEGYAEELDDKKAQKEATISKMTMGQLTNEYFKTIFDTSETELPPHEDPSQAYISFKYSRTRSKEKIDMEKQYFTELVEARNELAHHLLPEYDPTCLKSIEKLSESLEKQRERFLPALKNLTSLCEAHLKARQQLSEYLKSEEGKRHMAEGILPGETRLDKLLRDAASFSARKDGWSALSLAGQFIKSQPTDVIQKVCAEMGFSELLGVKALIEQSSVFELIRHPIKNGHILLYRPKPQSEQNH